MGVKFVWEKLHANEVEGVPLVVWKIEPCWLARWRLDAVVQESTLWANTENQLITDPKDKLHGVDKVGDGTCSGHRLIITLTFTLVGIGISLNDKSWFGWFTFCCVVTFNLCDQSFVRFSLILWQTTISRIKFFRQDSGVQLWICHLMYGWPVKCINLSPLHNEVSRRVVAKAAVLPTSRRVTKFTK